MLLSTLKLAKAKGVTTHYTDGRYTKPGETLNRTFKTVVFEGEQSGITLDAAVFQQPVSYDTKPTIYHLRHVEALVAGHYVVFIHDEEGIASLYKLSETKDNVLTYYQLAVASIFGLEDSRAIAMENAHSKTLDIGSTEEWEQFISSFKALGLIDESKEKAS